VGSIVVSWTAPTNARKAKVSGYRVTYRRLGTAKWRSLPRTGGSATSATISGLKAGSYSVGVVALTPYRHGSFASVRVTTSDPSIGSLAIGPTSANDTNPTPALPSPGAPRNFTATGGSGKVTLAWQAPESDGGSAIVAYQLRIRAAGSAGWFAPTNVRGGALSYELSLGGTSAYEFQVRAVNGNGAGAWSVTSSAAPTA
jgi:hypothetical protein